MRLPVSAEDAASERVIGRSSRPDAPMPKPRPSCKYNGRYSTDPNSAAPKQATTMFERHITGEARSFRGMIGSCTRNSQRDRAARHDRASASTPYSRQSLQPKRFPADE